jgi:hypothetical protein
MKEMQQAILEKDFKTFPELTMKASLLYILIGFVQELMLNKHSMEIYNNSPLPLYHRTQTFLIFHGTAKALANP